MERGWLHGLSFFTWGTFVKLQGYRSSYGMVWELHWGMLRE